MVVGITHGKMNKGSLDPKKDEEKDSAAGTQDTIVIKFIEGSMKNQQL